MSEAYAYPLLVKQLLHSALSTRATQEIIYPGVMRYTYAGFHARLQRAANVFEALGRGDAAHGERAAVAGSDRLHDQPCRG